MKSKRVPSPVIVATPEWAAEDAVWIDGIASRYEAHFALGERPVLESFLADASGTRRQQLLLELVQIEWSHRWQAGERVRVEDWLLRFAELASDPAARLVLLRRELALSKSAGAPLSLVELRRRFPDLETAVLHEVLGLEIELAEAEPNEAAEYQATCAPDNGSESLAATTPPVKAFEETRAFERPKAKAIAPPKLEGYEVLAELGRGGMGVVYKARQIKLDRLVALKMVLAGAHASDEQLGRFYLEAQAVAHLRHANIVQIHEVGEADGLPYFSLEYLEGGTLSQRFGGRPQPINDAAQLLEKLARAMAYAHEHGVLHRDLKPANVLLTAEGEPKISDFGLAKRLEGDSSHTQTGMVVGTPSYMSPEQARGEIRELGPATDIYALGVILYQALTGRTPFLGASVVDTLEQVRFHEPVPPSRLQPRVPRDLEVLCLKCLEKEASKRYASAAELADDLRRFLDGMPILARPVSAPERLWRWCRRNRKVAALSFAVLLLLVSMAVGSTVAAVAFSRQNHRLIQSTIESQQNATMAQANAAQSQKNETLAKKNETLAKRNERVAEEAKQLAEENEQHAIAAQKMATEKRQIAEQALDALVTKVQVQLQATPATQNLRRELLLAAVELLQKVHDKDEDRTSTDGKLAQAHQRIGKILEEYGKSAEAREHYETCHTITLEIAKNLPESRKTTAQRNVASSFNMLGNICRMLGDFEASLAHHREALAIREKLWKENPRDSRARSDLATSYVNLAPLSAPDTAEIYLKRALKFRQELAASAAPDEWKRLHRDLWVVLRDLAGLNEKQQNWSASQGYYTQALTLSRLLLDRTPDDVQARSDQALSLTNMGRAFRLAGQLETARAHFDEALPLLRLLATVDPEKLETQAEFALVLARCGDHREAAVQVEKVRAMASDNYRNLFNVASCYALCLRAVKERANDEDLSAPPLEDTYRKLSLQALSDSVAKGLTGAAEVAADADFAILQPDPEFQAILRRVP